MARQHGLLSEPTPASAAGIPAAHRRYALLILLMVPFGFATYLTPATRLALAAFIVPAFVGGVFIAPSFALNQGLVGAYAAVASALLLFILNSSGLGFGPQTIGVVSDLLRAPVWR